MHCLSCFEYGYRFHVGVSRYACHARTQTSGGRFAHMGEVRRSGRPATGANGDSRRTPGDEDPPLASAASP